MKRLIFVICALFVLSACTSSQVNTNVSIDEKVPVLFYYGLTEDGVFVNNTTGADTDDYRLDFFDFQNQKTYPFCTRSNCHHNSKDCQAYQMAHFENGTLFTVAAYKDYLYLIYEMSGDNGFDNVGFFIARCGMDGENIEKLFERKGGIQIPNYAYIYKDKIIYSYNTLSVTSMGGSTSTVGVLEMYDLDTKQITNIVNQDLQENRMNLFLGAKDDLIYFIDCDMTTMKKPVYSYDLKTQNKELVDENCPTDRSTLYQGYLYYADEENNKIIFLALSMGMAITIWLVICCFGTDGCDGEPILVLGTLIGAIAATVYCASLMREYNLKSALCAGAASILGMIAAVILIIIVFAVIAVVMAFFMITLSLVLAMLLIGLISGS